MLARDPGTVTGQCGGISNISISISLGIPNTTRPVSCRQCQGLSVPLSSCCWASLNPSQQRGQDRQCENDHVHGGSPSDVPVPVTVRHSYKSAGISQLASSPCRGRGQGRGEHAKLLFSTCSASHSFLGSQKYSAGPTAQYTSALVDADKPGEQYNTRDRGHRECSARACAFRFVSTIRLKVKS